MIKDDSGLKIGDHDGFVVLNVDFKSRAEVHDPPRQPWHVTSGRYVGVGGMWVQHVRV